MPDTYTYMQENGRTLWEVFSDLDCMDNYFEEVEVDTGDNKTGLKKRIPFLPEKLKVNKKVVGLPLGNE